jgi:membrane protease YdiL (CAAX protease family)
VAAPLTPEEYRSSWRLGRVPSYSLAVLVTAFAVLSQYFLPQRVPALHPIYGSFVGSLGVVYGVPALAFFVLVGGRPLSRYFSEPGRAATEGLRWFGLIFVLSLAVLFALTLVYLLVDPAALRLLNRPNPVIQAARSDPGFWIAFSFVVGFVEESLFRGWIFGYWLARGSRAWIGPAVLSSLLFAAVHLYYGVTYQAAAAFAFAQLFLLGMAFSVGMRYGRGAVFMVALLHGTYDAAGFLTLVSVRASLSLEYGVVAIGLILAALRYFQQRAAAPPPMSAWAGPMAGGSGDGSPGSGTTGPPSGGGPPDPADRPPLPPARVPPPPSGGAAFGRDPPGFSPAPLVHSPCPTRTSRFVRS